jgi:hypothetical protein
MHYLTCFKKVYYCYINNDWCLSTLNNQMNVSFHIVCDLVDTLLPGSKIDHYRGWDKAASYYWSPRKYIRMKGSKQRDGS